MARKKFFKSIWTKIRGGFGSAKYSMLLQDIDRDIDKISKLTSGAIQLEPLRTEKKKPFAVNILVEHSQSGTKTI